jgi:hypothetical protein
MQRENTEFRWFAAGLALGCTVMYLLDPVQGNRRRSYIAAKLTRFRNDSAWTLRRIGRDMSNRTRGWYAEYSHRGEHLVVDDATLAQRVRSEFGRKIRHPRAIETNVQDGVVILSGPILKDELTVLMSCVRGVKGVREVVNRLDVHHHHENISSLQGEGKPYLQ